MRAPPGPASADSVALSTLWPSAPPAKAIWKPSNSLRAASISTAVPPGRASEERSLWVKWVVRIHPGRSPTGQAPQS